MKKTITMIAFALGIYTIKAQTFVADFETFTLAANSSYSSATSAPFLDGGASFQFKWDVGFSYWSGGFSYTNNYDSTSANYTNLYGVKPLKGYNNSNIYTVAQDRGVINLTAVSNTVQGFYITNTTFAFKTIKNGNIFARKFGDTTGTGSGTTITQGSYPDWFKVTVKGYKAGVMLQDSVPFYLADFRNSNNTLDYIVDTWQWVNTSTLGNVDSVKFFMYSSDVGQNGINTPLFFGIDNFTTFQSIVGLAENNNNLNFNVYPNPFNSSLTINMDVENAALVSITDVCGKIVYQQQLNQMQTELNLNILQTGIYFLEIRSDNKKTTKKLIKN